MEERFIAAWEAAREQARDLGVRMRPIDPDDAIKQAKRCLSSHRESDGFSRLETLGRLDLTLEALAVRKSFTGLFTDEEANTALTRLLEAGYTFH